MTNYHEIIQAESTDVLVALVMRLTNGTANPDLARRCADRFKAIYAEVGSTDPEAVSAVKLFPPVPNDLVIKR